MIIKDIYISEHWQDYFMTVGTGAAALTGLLVVAMSPHLDVIIKDSSLRHRALAIIAGLGGAFIRCSLVLMGNQNQQAVGFELFIVSAIVTAICVNSFLYTFKHSKSLHKKIFYRTLWSCGLYMAEMIGSVIFITGYLLGLYIAAIAMIANFYFLISGSWLLLVGISEDESHEG